MRVLRHLPVVALAVALALTACAPSPTRTSSVTDTIATTIAKVTHGIHDSAPAEPQIRSMTFTSETLGRAMPYLIYLPPDYATSAKRYPVLYMLHGMGGSYEEWQSYGLLDRADAMIRARQLQPLIIVLPQGDRAYWVDHAVTDHEAWGRYMAKDVVAEIDAKFRTLPESTHRAIGGLSMGAHGAVQLALNYPGTFSVVGAHSLVLRRLDTAPAYFGQAADFAKRDPMTLAPTKTDVLGSLDLWIDIGDKDPWAKLAAQFDTELTGLRVAHVWHEWSGDHSASYWSSHLDDYLRFYGDALSHRTRVLHPVAPAFSF